MPLDRSIIDAIDAFRNEEGGMRKPELGRAPRVYREPLLRGHAPRTRRALTARRSA